jgi:hypothetical protein
LSKVCGKVWLPVLKKAAPLKCLKQQSSDLEVFKRQLTQANLHQLTSFTANEGLVRIQYECLVSIYAFLEMTLLGPFPKQNYKDLSPNFTFMYL